MERYEFNYGLLDSPIDERNYVYGNICNGGGELPDKFMVNTGQVRHQMSTNHCASYSVSYVTTSDIKEKNGEDITISPMFIHKNAKANDGIKNATGSHIYETMKSVCKYGVCLESDYPSTNLLTNDFPICSDSVYEKALKYKQDGYAQVSLDVNAIKRAIYDNNGSVAHIKIFSNYHKECWIPRPPKDREPEGSHAIAIVGWDDNLSHTYNGGETITGFFILRESYGETGRTNKSYLYLPYQAISEKWRGKYSVDLLIKEVWSTYTNSKVTLPDYYKHNQDENNVAFKPNKTIKMTLGSNIAYVNGSKQTLDVTPSAPTGTTFVPINFIAQMLGHTVRWYQSEKRVNIFAPKLNKSIDMWIGNCVAKVKDTGVEKDYYFVEAPKIDSGRTLIPLRAVEMLNCRVDFDTKTKEITITEQ